MKSRSLKVPIKNKEIILHPDYSCISKIIEENMRILNNNNIKIFHKSFNSLRNRYRIDLIKKTLSFTDIITPSRLPFSEKSVDCIIMTGHQPEFYHPGVWIKNILLNQIIKENSSKNIFGINLNLDNDVVNPVSIYYPAINTEIDNNIQKNSSDISLRKHILSINNNEIPLQELQIPSKEMLLNVLKKINKSIQFLPDNTYQNYNVFSNCFKNAYKICKSTPAMNQLGIFMTTCRRLYESTINPQYYDLPYSFISNHDSLLLFFLEIVFNIEYFSYIYNKSLHEYRLAHKIKNAANPLPNLSTDNNRIETPFWIWKRGERSERKKIFIKKQNGSIFIEDIYGDNIALFSIINGKEDIVFTKFKKHIQENNYILYPRAIILTLFNRLFGADLFIHGIGGSKYDCITDDIIQKYFKIIPPRFLTISATFLLDLPVKTTTIEAISVLEKKKRTIQYNPEKIIDEANLPEEKNQMINKLIKEKHDLIKIIQNTPSNQKYIVSKKINEINKNITEILSDYEKYISGKIEDSKKFIENDKVSQFRKFPYFFFNGNKIAEELIKKTKK